MGSPPLPARRPARDAMYVKPTDVCQTCQLHIVLRPDRPILEGWSRADHGLGEGGDRTPRALHPGTSRHWHLAKRWTYQPARLTVSGAIPRLDVLNHPGQISKSAFRLPSSSSFLGSHPSTTLTRRTIINHSIMWTGNLRNQFHHHLAPAAANDL